MPGGLDLETTPVNVLKVYSLLLQHYILKDFLKTILAEFRLNVIQPKIIESF